MCTSQRTGSKWHSSPDDCGFFFSFLSFLNSGSSFTILVLNSSREATIKVTATTADTTREALGYKEVKKLVTSRWGSWELNPAFEPFVYSPPGPSPQAGFALLPSYRKVTQPGTKLGTRNAQFLFTNNAEWSSLSFRNFVNYYRYLPATDFLKQTSPFLSK